MIITEAHFQQIGWLVGVIYLHFILAEILVSCLKMSAAQRMCVAVFFIPCLPTLSIRVFSLLAPFQAVSYLLSHIPKVATVTSVFCVRHNVVGKVDLAPVIL